MCETVRTYIDENGKEWETVKETCPRCGGKGNHDSNGWQYYNQGNCFKCEGKGYILTDRRILTTKEKAQRAKAIEKKEKVKNSKRLEELNQMNNRDKKEAGFTTDTIYCVMSDSYSIKEQLKAEGAKWNSKFKKWVFDENNENRNKYELKAVNYMDVAIVTKCFDNDPIERITFEFGKMYDFVN